MDKEFYPKERAAGINPPLALWGRTPNTSRRKRRRGPPALKVGISEDGKSRA
jgi:hypothetical protein